MHSNILKQKNTVEKTFGIFLFIFFVTLFLSQWLPVWIIKGSLIFVFVSGSVLMVLVVRQSQLKAKIVRALSRENVGVITVRGIRRNVCIQNVQGRFSVHGNTCSVHSSAITAVNQASDLAGGIYSYAVARYEAAGSARQYVKEKKPKKQKK